MKKLVYLVAPLMCLTTLVGCKTNGDDPIKTYTVTWLNDNGELLEEDKEVKVDIHPTFDKDTPKSGNIPATGHSFKFIGWTDEDGIDYDHHYVIKDHDVTFTAKYEDLTNVHELQWINDDDSLINSEMVAYGEHPTHDDPTSKKTTKKGYHFEFSNWTSQDGDYDDDFLMPDHDVIFKANYNEAPNVHNIYWINDTGLEIDSNKLAYNEHPTHDTPQSGLPNPTGKHYSFKNWIDSKGVELTEDYLMPDNDVFFTAHYDLETNVYTVTWKDDKGEVVDTTSVEYEGVPQHDAITKESSDTFDYYFEGWYDLNGVKLDENYKVTSNVTFTAKFNEVAIGGCTYQLNSDGNSYQVTGLDGNYPKKDSYVEILDDYEGKPVTSIAAGAFYNKEYKFVTLKIGNNVEVIGESAIRNLDELKNVVIDPDKSKLRTIGSWGLKSRYIDGSLTFPSTIESIGEYALQSCDYLDVLDISRADRIVALGGGALTSTSHNLQIYVKNSLVEDYKSDSNWGAYAGQIQGK